MQIKSFIMDKAQIERSIRRMAHEIIEQNRGVEKIRLVGIRSRGVPLANRLSEYLRLIEGQLEVAFDDEAGIFVYFPTGHRTRRIGPPPHPSWREVAYTR